MSTLLQNECEMTFITLDVFCVFRMEDMSKIDPIMFQPFGVGPRSCIAMRFALMEVKMAISKILLNFRLDVADDTPVSSSHGTLHRYCCYFNARCTGNQQKIQSIAGCFQSCFTQ